MTEGETSDRSERCERGDRGNGQIYSLVFVAFLASFAFVAFCQEKSSCDQSSSTGPMATQACSPKMGEVSPRLEGGADGGEAALESTAVHQKTLIPVLASTPPVKTTLPVADKSQKKENKVKMPAEWTDFFGGLPEGGAYVIRDTESWKNLWVRIREGEPPQVDFSKQMILAAFLGMKPTGGYAIKISKIEKSKKKWTVFIQESRPPQGAFVIQAFTSPYHIEVVEKTDLPVEFKKIK